MEEGVESGSLHNNFSSWDVKRIQKNKHRDWKTLNSYRLEALQSADVGPKSRPKSRLRPAYAAALPLPVCESSHNHFYGAVD